MTQSLTVSVTAALASVISSSHQDAWVVYFDSGGKNAQWTSMTMPSTGGFVTSLTTLPTPSNQPVFFVIQDRMGGTISSVSSTISSIGQLNWDAGAGTNPITLNYRMAALEATFSGSPNAINDSGDLTSINGFTIPMELTVSYTSGSATTSGTRGFNLSGGTVSTTVAGGVQTVTGGSGLLYDLANAGGFVHYYSGTTTPMLVAGPGTAISSTNYGSAFQPADWNYYISALTSNGAMTDGNANQIRLAGYYNGAKDNLGVWHNAGIYSYRATYDSTTSNIVLKPDSNSEIKGAITLTIDELASNVYQQRSNFTVGGITGSLTSSSQGIGYNTEWSVVVRDLVTGLDGGFFGRTGSSLNTSVTGSINLNQEWNWDPTYIFQSHTSGAIADGPATTPGQPRNNLYDPWAKVLFDHSNGYGWPYTDNQMAAMTIGPLIPLNSWPAATDDSQHISVTLFADSEVPNNNDYTTPQVRNYIAGGYATPVYNTDSTNLTIVASAGTMALPIDTPVTVRFMNAASPYDHVTMSAAGYYTMNSGTQGYSVSPNGGTTAVAGIYQFTHFAFASGTNWYQIEVGSGSAAKTYNLYWSAAVGADSNVHLLNPGYVVNGAYVQSGDVAIDGLAQTTEANDPTNSITTTPQVNLTVGGAFYFDPSQLTRIVGSSIPGSATNSQTSFPIPYAPMLGSRSTPTGDFTHIVPLSSFASSATAAALTPNSQTITNSKDVFFGWYGADNAYISSQNTQAALPTPTGTYYVSGYTNKIGGQNVASLTLTNSGSMLINHAALIVTADSDGQWTTSTPIHFGAGTGSYAIAMTEFLPTDTAFATSAAKPSAPQSFTINTAADTVSHGNATVNNAATISDTVFDTAGSLVTINSGGTTQAVTLSNGTSATVSSGGIAYWSFISAGAQISIQSSGTTSGSVMISAVENVSSGATAFGTDLRTHAHSFVAFGGSVSGMYVSNSGSGWISGTAVSTTLAGGHQTISQGGIASNTLALSGGYEHVSSGGITSGTTVSNGGAEYVESSGIARGTLVTNNGRLVVNLGGTASGAILTAFGDAVVSGGGTISGAVISGSGSAWISGTAVSTTLAGGHQTIYSGGVANGTQLQSGGYEHISSGGSASGVVVSAAAAEYVSLGGILSGATLSGGDIVVSAGGIVSGTIAFAGGATGSGNLILSQSVAFTAGISGLTNAAQIIFLRDINYGTGLVVSNYAGNVLTLGDSLTHTATLNISGAYTGASFHVASAWDGNGGTMLWDPPLDGGATLSVPAGDTVSGTIVGESASNVVLGTALDTTLSGGLQIVSSGGVASGTQVLSGGSEYVSAGGIASEAVVGSSGSEVVDSGGVLTDATLSGGTLTVFAGGVAGGTIAFAGDGLMKLADADSFSGTVAGLAGDTATIDLMDVSFADASLTWSAGSGGGVLTITDGADTATLNLIGQYAATDFRLSGDAGGGTLVQAQPATGDPPTLMIGSHHG